MRCRDAGAQRLLETAGDRRALGVGEIAPERVVRVARGSARRSALRAPRAARAAPDRSSCRGSVLPFEHVVPQRDPRDAARQAIADLGQMSQEELPASCRRA